MISMSYNVESHTTTMSHQQTEKHSDVTHRLLNAIIGPEAAYFPALYSEQMKLGYASFAQFIPDSYECCERGCIFIR